MKYGYSSNRNIQMIISVLKQYNINRVIVSPGSTHLNLVASLQQDPFFSLYSEIDERNAAYIACGMSAETGEPVVISCTGATASRDFLPALTEAYYRKLPILVITGSQDVMNTDNLSPQYIDRSVLPNDAIKYSVHLQTIKDKNDEWDCNLKINRAVSELFRHGGGPVHINLTSEYGADTFGIMELPNTRTISRYEQKDTLPPFPSSGKIAVSIGAHKPISPILEKAIDNFCSVHDAVVFTDHSSGGYNGKYRINSALIAAQEYNPNNIFKVDLLIHIGEQSGDYYTYGKLFSAKEVWRVSEDGEMRDTFHKLTKVFEMPEEVFFRHYSNGNTDNDSFLTECQALSESLHSVIPDMPFSNLYIARYLSSRLPDQSIIHFGVSNTMRSWTFFDVHCKMIWANVGCRGIDGALPAFIGMSLSAPNTIHYCFLGDLTFFYSMNELGNRQIQKNVRILLVNNGIGTEFKLYPHKAQRTFDADANPFIAAEGHFGNKSKTLVKNYTEALGFEYISAENEEEFLRAAERFLAPELTEKPLMFEVFTNAEDESTALKKIRNLIERPEEPTNFAKEAAKKILGQNGVNAVKRIFGK